MALLLIPVVLIVAMVVVERTRDGGRRPISQENPFRDMNLPESSSGSAEGREHEVPTEETQAVQAPDPAAVERAVPDLPGAVPTTPGLRDVRLTDPQASPKPSPPPAAAGGATAPAGGAAARPGGELRAEFGESRTVRPDRGPARDGKPQAGRTELVERRTESTREFRNPDGSLTTETSMGPARFQDARGGWVDIDTALEQAGAGRLRSASTEHVVEVAQDAKDPRLGRIELGEGTSFSFGLVGAAPSRAEVDGPKATFADIRESADLELGAVAGGMKEVIVLQSAAAPTVWEFPLEMEGLTARLDGRQVLLEDAAGEARGVVPPGWMEDSRTEGGMAATSDGVVYSLVEGEDGGQVLRVELDRAWLNDPARVYPIRVDPAVIGDSLYVGGDDTYISSLQPNTNYSSLPAFYAGKYQTDVQRGYLNFPGRSELTGAHITNAHLKIFNYDSAGGCTPYPVSLRQVLIPWNGYNMTWPGATMGPVVAEGTFARDQGNPACLPQWEYIGNSDDRLRDLVHLWTHNAYANFGLAVTASETNDDARKAFYTANCWCNPADPPSDFRPKLEINWSSNGAQYSYPNGAPQWVTMPTATTPGTVMVRVKNSGQTAWAANSAFKLAYHVYQNGVLYDQEGAETNLPVAVNPGGTIDLAATVDPLPAGTYEIRWDMKQSGVAWFSSWGVDYMSTPLTLSAAQPLVTGVAPPNGTEVSSLRPTLSASGSDPDNAPNPLTFQFQLCTGTDAASGSCWDSGWQSGTTWQPPAGALTWGTIYYWRVRVSDGLYQSSWLGPIAVRPVAAQSTTEASLGRDPYVPPVSHVHPLAQNYSSTVTDAAVSGVGPALSVSRTYNSLSSSDGIFGPGWTSEFDRSANPEAAGDGDILVRKADGRVERFGRNTDGTFAPPQGVYSLLQAPSPRIASFTSANSTTSLGLADTGESWQVLDGTWGISNNNAYLVSGSIWQRNAAVMPAAADGTVRFTAPVAQDGIGVAFRVQDIDNMWMLYVQPSTNSLVLAKRVSGSETQVATIANACCSANDTYAVTTSGSQITVLRNNQVVGSATDSAFSTVTRAGIYWASAGSGRIGSINLIDDQHRDTITRANSTTSLGTTDNGEKWQNVGSAAWGVNGNAAYLATASGTRNVATVSGAADGAFSFTMPVAQAGLGLAFRYADPANYWRLVAQPSAGTWQLVKRDDNVETTVATSAAGTCCTAADVLRVETNGAQIRVLRNGTQILLVNDPSVYYGSRAGPFAEATGAGRLDNLVLSAATTLTEKGGSSYAFRSDGRLTRVTDSAARQLQLAYDGNARLTSATSVTSGRALTLGWSGGRVSSVATASVAAHSGALTWNYGYTSGRLTSVTAPHSTTPLTYTYGTSGGANGRLTQINLPRGNIDTRVGYNTDGTVAWREDGLARRTTFAIHATGATTTIRITDPRGHATDWKYQNGQLISRLDGTDERTFSYNDRGFLTQVRDENNNLLSMQTDTRGNVLSRTTTRAMIGTSPVLNTEYYSYFVGAPGDPRNDLITAYRDARSSSPTHDVYRTTYTYNAAGDLIQTRTPSTPDFPTGRTTSSAFTNGTEAAVTGGGTVPRGLLASQTDARGKVTTFGYDSKGDLRRDQDPAGLVHEYTYDEIGRRLTSREISDTYPSGLTTTTTYTKLSRVATVTAPGVTNPINSTTRTAVTTNSYDLNSNLTQVVVSDSTGGDAARTTTYTYDNADQQTSQTIAAGTSAASTTSLTYDPNGNIATRTDGNGTVTTYAYTAKNLLATTTVEDFVDDPVAGSTPRDLLAESRAYDPAGRLASVTDAEGRTTDHTYWLDDLPRQEILRGYRPPDLTNGVLSGPGAYDIVLVDRTYDAAGNPTSTSTGGGLRTAETAYDAAGRVTSNTVAPGSVARTATYTYDAGDNVTSTVLGAAGTAATERVDVAYDDASRPTSETVFGDGTATYVTTVQHDQRGFVTGVTDPRGHVAGGPPNPAFRTTVETNQIGVTSRTTSPLVAVEEWSGSPTDQTQTVDGILNVHGEVIRDRDARGNVTSITYNAAGQVTGRSGQPYTPPGGSAITPTESWTYDDNGNVLTHTDARGETTTTVYDKLNRPVAITDPQVGSATAGVSRILYDDIGNVVSTVNQLGAWTFYAYDDLDRVWATTETERTPAATFTTYTVHNNAGDLVRIRKPANAAGGQSQTAVYNQAGDLIESRTETNDLTTYGYDLAGRLVEATDPLGRSTRTTYDRAGRQVEVAQYSPADVELRSTSTVYDAVGNPVSETDPRGWTTTATYDALNQLRTVTEPVDASTSITTTFGYAKGGKLTRRTDGRGNRVIYTYNPLLLRESVVEAPTTAHPAAADREWKTSYDAGGLPVSVAAPGGVVRSRTFDELGRLTVETGSGGGATGAARSFTYDLAGQVTSFSHPWGTQNTTYNDRGLVTGTTGDGGTTTFTYDVNGRMISRGDPGSYSAFGYNSRGDLNLITGTATGGSRSLHYDVASQLTSITYANPGATRGFGYDDLGRTVSDTLTGPGGTLREQTYTYDAGDNQLSTTIGPAGVASAGTQTYTYDRANRLTSWTDPASATTTYGWDAAGNRTSVNGVAATFDQRNRLLTDGTATYTHTPRGTLATRVQGTTTTTTTGFDAFDQLVSDTTGTTTTAYGYDALGRLAVRNGTRLVYGGLERETVTDGTQAFSRDPDGDLISVGTSTGNWATLTNTHGDVVAAFPTNGASLAVDRSYDPFGEPAVTSTTALRIGYQGSWTDPTTTKISAQARWYTPGTSTFISRDPADLPFTSAAGTNRYTYAGANPLAYNDPTGYWPSWGDVKKVGKTIGSAIYDNTVGDVLNDGKDIVSGLRKGGIGGAVAPLAKFGLKRLPIATAARIGLKIYEYNDKFNRARDVYEDLTRAPEGRQGRPERNDRQQEQGPTAASSWASPDYPSYSGSPGSSYSSPYRSTYRSGSSTTGRYASTSSAPAAEQVNLEWLNAPLISATNPTNI
ncbi:DNRLRE domain-containing protein, partial [Parafrankia sp. FMc2]|uniref:DNRLRE domain-containing protein n=1 Tax=Parafrankia sp. FMc2 TaxID=3233196 RepID=UPI0034D5C389